MSDNSPVGGSHGPRQALEPVETPTNQTNQTSHGQARHPHQKSFRILRLPSAKSLALEFAIFEINMPLGGGRTFDEDEQHMRWPVRNTPITIKSSARYVTLIWSRFVMAGRRRHAETSLLHKEALDGLLHASWPQAPGIRSFNRVEIGHVLHACGHCPQCPVHRGGMVVG